MNDFGERLKEERLKLGLSQEDFGVIGKVTKLSQFNYEKGERSPNADYLALAANAGVDVMYVLTGMRTSIDTSQLTPRETSLLDNFNKMAEEDKGAFERLAQTVQKPINKT